MNEEEKNDICKEMVVAVCLPLGYLQVQLPHRALCVCVSPTLLVLPRCLVAPSPMGKLPREKVNILPFTFTKLHGFGNVFPVCFSHADHCQ